MATTERYVYPILTAPLDLAAHLALAPKHGKVKGMFFRRIIEETKTVSGRSMHARPYFSFSDYPLADWLTLLHDAALFAYPKEPVRAGLRRLGRSMYATFVESMIGKVVFSVAQGNIMQALPLYPRIWSVVSNHGSAEVDELTEGRVVIRLRNVWDFLDSFQLGALEGGVSFFGVTADVKLHSISPSDADFEVTWRD
jgi:uncharacterized protein (TIGR02265 family)